MILDSKQSAKLVKEWLKAQHSGQVAVVDVDTASHLSWQLRQCVYLLLDAKGSLQEERMREFDWAQQRARVADSGHPHERGAAVVGESLAGDVLVLDESARDAEEEDLWHARLILAGQPGG